MSVLFPLLLADDDSHPIELGQYTTVDLAHQLDLNAAALTKGEDDIEVALSIVTDLEAKWDQADEDQKRVILETLFVKLVVDQRKIIDVEVKNPYSWIIRWKLEERGLVTADSVRTIPLG